MTRTFCLKKSLISLFRGGADEDHDADEMQSLLDGIDFSTLLQALYSMREPVYQYHVYGDFDEGFEYYGQELIDDAVLLCTDARDVVVDAAFHEQALELWLLFDARFLVTSRVRTVVGSDESVMEYRSIKGGNWRETEMDIDFLDLSDDLEELCAAVRAHDLPLYEL